MNVIDWSGAEPDAVAALYARESQQWRDAFDWDTVAQWREVETARRTWGLPGLLARDEAGATAGWLFYLPGPAGIQLGGVSATESSVTHALVSSLVAREPGRPLTGFMPALAPGLDHALRTSGCDTTAHRHLVASLKHGRGDVAPAPGGEALGVRPWAAGDECVAGEILRESYDAGDARLFAPTGAPSEWQAYVSSLVDHIGCGRFSPECSVIAECEGRPVGVAIVTMVSEGMAHLAQTGVSRTMQGRGVGTAVLRQAMAAARASGARAMSLLVSERNPGALALYERFGFESRGSFLEARSAALSSLRRISRAD